MTAPDNPHRDTDPTAAAAARRAEGPVPVPAGFLVVDKPVGPSSMQAVAAVRRRVLAWVRAGEPEPAPGERPPKRKIRVGHAGTLDPLASGVLVLGVGAATRQLESVMVGAKRYETIVDLSAFTATDDAEGERELVAVQTPPEHDAVAEAVASFRGQILQRPPSFSAVKVGGRRAYAMARGGDAPELAARPVEVHDIELLAYAWPLATVAIHTGKGFYVRSFARDLGRRLGTGGTCLSIRRTAVEPFGIAEAWSMDALPDLIGPDQLLPMRPDSVVDGDAAPGASAD